MNGQILYKAPDPAKNNIKWKFYKIFRENFSHVIELIRADDYNGLVRFVQSEGVNLKYANLDGWTALHEISKSIKNQSEEICTFIMSYNVDKNALGCEPTSGKGA